jgi:DNA-directed RNA polymerase subunit beta
MPVGYRNGKIQDFDDDEIDYELISHENLFGTHINHIPIQSGVQGPRLFYGARFDNQAMPLRNREAPWVQNLDTTDDGGFSFDEKLGKDLGAVFADEDGEVTEVTPDYIHYKNATGEKKKRAIYNNQSFNRKSGIHNTSKVKVGDKFTAGGLLATSNYTDDNGTAAMGMNTRVAVVPYKGYSMDDAIVLRKGFADNMVSEHMETHEQEYDRDIKGGLGHFRSLFPEKFHKKQLAKLDERGVVQKGQILDPGDPIILSTRPRVISSAGVNVGKLTKTMSQARGDSSSVWEEEYPAEVVDVFHTPKGVKVVTKAYAPTKEGDKVVYRTGQKGTVSLVIPDEKMPRTKDGQPLDVLLNPLSIPSRTNNSLLYEIMLGKVAAAQGKPIKLPGFTKPGEKWYETVLQKLEEAGIPDEEEIFDPETNQFLENPVLVGNAYMLKLHHTSSSKASSRGQGGYDLFRQPAKGSGEGGGSKRLSGLESNVMLSSGAYNNLREGITLRGQQNDEYWRALRMGLTPAKPGVPFSWDKTMNTMVGAGITPRNVGKGILRLAPTTDKDVDDKNAIEIQKGELLNLNNMAPVTGGLFDPAIVGNNGWGKITLPFRIPNPAFAESIRHLLGLKRQEMEDILAGKLDLDEVRNRKHR